MPSRGSKYGSLVCGALLAWGGCGADLWNWWVALGVQVLLVWLWLFDAAVRRQADQERKKIRELLERN